MLKKLVTNSCRLFAVVRSTTTLLTMWWRLPAATKASTALSCWRRTSNNLTSSKLKIGENDIELPASIPGTGYFQNATSVLKSFSQQFDSATKNFTMSPNNLFSRVRERFNARMERIKRRWLEARMKMGNRTLSMIERIVSRVDQKMEQMKPDKDGNETTATKMGVVLRAFLKSLRNTVQGMVENLQTAAKEPVKWGEDAATSLKNAIEHEEPSSKAIKELNSALKKLDKETRDKFNDI